MFKCSFLFLTAVCGVSLLSALAAEDLPEPGRAYEIEDGGRVRTFVVVGNQVGIKAALGSPRVLKASVAGLSLQEQFRLARAQDPAITETNLALVETGLKGRGGREPAPRLLTCLVLVELPLDADVAALAALVGATGVESPVYAPGQHLFACADQGGALRLMERLRARPEVLRANALLTRPLIRKYTPNDPFFANNPANAGYCWHLKNTGARGGTAGIDLNVNTTTCWDLYRGVGVTIGVIDDGVETSHTDLFANVEAAAGYDFLDHDTNPAPGVNDDHGTSVAGLALARGNNTVGTCGVAPEARLAALRIGLNNIDDLQISNAFAHQNNVISIKTNSWGPADTGYSLEGPGTLTLAALQDAITNGRSGRGTIFIFAAGNGANVGDNSNYDGFANSIYTIAVTAVSDEGTPTYFAEPGANIVAAALGDNDDDQGVTSTDRTGTAGYNDGTFTSEYANTAYTNSFGGTSAAAPQAAGVIALMLQAKAALGWRDVQELLIKTARVTNAADTDWTTNAGGFHFNHKYGAGLIDASAAVSAALVRTNLGAQLSVSLTNGNLALPIPDAPNAAGVTTSFNFASQASLRVEQVTVQVDATHPRRGDLEISLTSPSGMVSRLAEEHDDDTADYHWTFMSVRHWGENSTGDWKLIVVDRAAKDVGTLDSVTVKIYGTAATAPSGAPVVKSLGTASVPVGAPFVYQITASNVPTSFNATGLPDGLTLNPATGLISGRPMTAAATNVSLTAVNASGTSAIRTLAITVAAVSTLANALDNPDVTWETGGDGTWARQTTTTHDNTDAAKPSALAVNSIAYLKAFVEGPKLITYWRRVASQTNVDYLDFSVDGKLLDSETGTLGWTQKTHYLNAGRHSIRWQMYRDSSSALSSSTAYVDQVGIADPNTAPAYIIHESGERNAPVGGKTCFRVSAVGLPPLTYLWKRNGVDVPNSNSEVLLVEPVPAGNATYTCTVSNSLNLARMTSTPAVLNLTPAATATALGDGLDNSQLSFGTSPAAGSSVRSWFRYALAAGSAVQSGDIGDNESTSLEACITGPALLKFSWAISSEVNGDYLQLEADDYVIDGITGSVSWTPYSWNVPAGPHVISWKYVKDITISFGSDAGQVDGVSLTPTGYEGWAALKFTAAQRATPNLTGPLDDADQDGLRNLLEYALGLNPNLRDQQLAPLPVRNGNALEFTFPKNTLLKDISYIPETSPTLNGNWTPLTPVDLTGAGEVRMMKVSLPLNALRGFVRLRITQP